MKKDGTLPLAVGKGSNLNPLHEGTKRSGRFHRPDHNRLLDHILSLHRFCARHRRPLPRCGKECEKGAKERTNGREWEKKEERTECGNIEKHKINKGNAGRKKKKIKTKELL
jgi:hypothetical protein